MGEGDRQVQNSSCKASPGDVMCNRVTLVNKYRTVYLRVAKRVVLKSSHHEKKVAMHGDGC